MKVIVLELENFLLCNCNATYQDITLINNTQLLLF